MSHHHGHSHGVTASGDRRLLIASLAIIGLFMLVEVVAGVLTGSLALISDAAHMLTDAGSLLLALGAVLLAARPVSARYTFGLGRSEIVSTQINAVALIVFAVVIAWQAVERLFDPPSVEAGWVMVVGAIGMLVNIVVAVLLARAKRQSLNIAGARAHVLADLYGSVAVVVTGVIIFSTGFQAADSIAALLVAVLMLRSGISLLMQSGRVLLEASPHGLDQNAVVSAMLEMDGVQEVHDFHLWEITTHFPALSAHVLVDAGADCHSIREAASAMLHEKFHIQHTTLQVEHLQGSIQLENRLS